MTRVSFLRLAALLVAAAPASPQAQSPPPGNTVIRINVNLVQVDAVVTDSRDQPVADLAAADFQILQDGRPQKITNFSYVATAGANPAPAAARPARGKGSPALPPARIRPADVRRTVALVVDDLGLSFDGTARVRQALTKFVDQEMHPGDLVAILRTGAGMGALQQFTADRRLLHAAIDRVRFNMLGRVGIGSFQPLGQEPDMGPDLAAFLTRVNEEHTSIFTAGTLGAVRYVVDGLRELRGRKSVILFSENMRLVNSEGLDQRVMDAVHHLAAAANRASVVIYSVDPRGLQYFGPAAADNTSRMTADQLSEVARRRSEEVFASQDGLVMLAHETGGLFMHNRNDIDGAVRQAMHDSEGYYLIGYRPPANTFDSRTGEPGFHRLTVRVSRPGLHVRYRSGFFGTSDREQQAMPRTRATEIAQALASPFGAAGIHVRLTPMFAVSPETGPQLDTLLHLDARDLKFTEEPDGWHKAVFDMVAMTFGDSGEAADSTDKTWTVRIRGQTYESALKDGLVYAASQPVKRPGAYQVRVVVRDTTTEEVGSASQFIEVPDVKRGRLTLSSILLREQDPMPPGGDTASQAVPEGRVAESNPEGSAAVRILRPGATIAFRYQILNARIGIREPVGAGD